MPVNARPPVAFLEDSEAVNINEEQAEVEEQILDRFVQMLNGEKSSVNDPGYAERWRTAQAEADEAFRINFGNAALNARGIQMAGEAPEPSPSAKGR